MTAMSELDELAALVLNDPQRANLREVLWETCTYCGGGTPEPGIATCHRCNGSKLSRRTWDGPDWWLNELVPRAALRDGLVLGKGKPVSAVLATLKVTA